MSVINHIRYHYAISFRLITIQSNSLTRRPNAANRCNTTQFSVLADWFCVIKSDLNQLEGKLCPFDCFAVLIVLIELNIDQMIKSNRVWPLWVLCHSSDFAEVTVFLLAFCCLENHKSLISIDGKFSSIALITHSAFYKWLHVYTAQIELMTLLTAVPRGAGFCAFRYSHPADTKQQLTSVLHVSPVQACHCTSRNVTNIIPATATLL